MNCIGDMMSFVGIDGFERFIDGTGAREEGSPKRNTTLVPMKMPTSDGGYFYLPANACGYGRLFG